MNYCKLQMLGENAMAVVSIFKINRRQGISFVSEAGKWRHLNVINSHLNATSQVGKCDGQDKSPNTLLIAKFCSALGHQIIQCRHDSSNRTIHFPLSANSVVAFNNDFKFTITFIQTTMTAINKSTIHSFMSCGIAVYFVKV